MKQTYSFLALVALAASMTIIATAHAQPDPFTQKPFTDMPKTHANYDAVEYLRLNNVLRGYPDGTFRPGARMTRAEFVALLTNPFIFAQQRSNDCLKSISGSGSTKVFFSDVRKDIWYAQDICEAFTHDIIRGYPDGTFKPHNYISFVEAAKVINRVLSQDVRQGDINDEFWYTAYVRRLAELKAIPLTIRKLTQTMTRGEMAEMIYRVKVGNSTKASMRFEDFPKP